MKRIVALALAGTAMSLEPNRVVGDLKQYYKKAGGIIKHNTNVVKNLAATQDFPSDNVDEGNSPEPPAKKAKQPTKAAAGVPAHAGRDGARGLGGRWAVRDDAGQPPGRHGSSHCRHPQAGPPWYDQ
eukprot:jgi/Tetstr1/421167/TSEL_012210.t1